MTLNQYRSDIDGLRFLAIIPVVLYHAEIPGFSGGFVGVDVFFVISGYLITKIILNELQLGEFSIIRFYERRIRRIFPALFSVIAFVCIFSPAALLPSDLRKLPYEIIGALAFIANIVFWKQSGYFEAATEEKPLLHTWSLGVEEQFYIFAPLILWVFVIYARKLLLPVIFGATITSLMLCVVFTPISPTSAFYLLPFRAWELLVGSFIAASALTSSHRLPSHLREGIALIGMALLLYATFTYDASTPFPGYVATVPVIGSALIIIYGQGSLVGRILSIRPLVFIGLISYSLYLWHWPLIVFFEDWNLLESLNGRLFVVIVSVFFAFISWKFIETPFRNTSNWPGPRIFKFTAASSAIIVFVTFGLYLTNGWPSRFSPEIVAFDASRDDISPERERCHTKSVKDLCRLGTKNGEEPSTILWADSHGVEIAAALAEAGLPLIQATSSSCPPAIGLHVNNRPKCHSHNKEVLSYIMSNNIENVILTSYYVGNDHPDFWRGMKETILTLKSAKKNVIVIGPAPSFGVNIPSYLSKGNREPMPYKNISPDFYKNIENAPIVSLIDKFCSEGVCSTIVENSSILFDDNHISMTAARSIQFKLVGEIALYTN